MHSVELILTLTGGFAAALLFGYITHRLGLSPIIGYLMAGIVVSPNTPGFVANYELAEQLAEIGVILLMFGVGLQFHFKEFFAVRKIALPGALLQSFSATLVGALIMYWLGWSIEAGIVFGLAISVASTVVLTRVLSDNNDLHTKTGHIAIGWLVMEDLFTVFVLVLLPEIFGSTVIGFGGIATATGIAILKILILVGFTFAVGGWLIPKILTNIAKTGSRELFTLAILAIAMCIAVGSAYVFDVSMALGAFLAGMVVGRSEFSLRAATEALPLRDAFAVLFFVSVGMLFDWSGFTDSFGLVIVTLVIILIGKPLVAFLIVIIMRYPLKVALSVAIVLAQIGEFSFILATMGRDLHILPENATNILVAAAIISITVNPILYRGAGKLECWLNDCSPGFSRKIHNRCGPMDTKVKKPDYPGETKAVVIGYGPVGQTVTGLLMENDIHPTIIELNVETVQGLLKEGFSAIYGDATRSDTLKEAGITHAEVLIISVANIPGSVEVVKQAKYLNPDIRIIARTVYLSEISDLCSAGADVVFSDEGELALSITEFIIRQSGATPEQIDRERDRIHEKLIVQTRENLI
ncbi:cation:proton antiporter [Methanospirillum stamsii]|uniref:Sodium:proton exchanger n=1 Tax=Methanospirillum stamsii TaxID=1277351 RepID=A0A2V2N3S6_9EURY|nr:cation:proton antiporter [Methanospirillum stamsii]PWR71178.1 sodium:proton exchanger [Methanospirillum stamsii]